MLDLNSFDESKVEWDPLPGPDGSPADHIGMSILNIDDEAKIVDVLFKFAANEKILLHKHTAAFNTFVVKGEHRIYTPEGELTEVRPAGTYKAGVANEEPHTEIPIYEILDENRDVAATMNFNALKELHESKAA